MHVGVCLDPGGRNSCWDSGQTELWFVLVKPKTIPLILFKAQSLGGLSERSLGK